MPSNQWYIEAAPVYKHRSLIRIRIVQTDTHQYHCIYINHFQSFFLLYLSQLNNFHFENVDWRHHPMDEIHRFHRQTLKFNGFTWFPLNFEIFFSHFFLRLPKTLFFVIVQFHQCNFIRLVISTFRLQHRTFHFITLSTKIVLILTNSSRNTYND